MKKWIALIIVVTLTSLLITGCGYSIQPGSSTSSSPTGTLTVRVTDAPSYTVNSTVIHFSEVWVHKAPDGEDGEGEWMSLNITGGMQGEGYFDLAVLRDQGAIEELAATELEVGNYTQLRVVMNEDEGVLVDYEGNEGGPVKAKLASGTLKFVGPFTVESEGNTDIVLDFDLQKSVVFTGNFGKEPNPNKPEKDSIIVKPVVKVQVTSTPEVSATPESSELDQEPVIPTGLEATASDGEVALNWDDNTDADLKEYNVYRSEVSGGPYDQIDTVADSEYADEAVTNGTTYYYVVTALDESDNESGNSNEVSATPTSS